MDTLLVKPTDHYLHRLTLLPGNLLISNSGHRSSLSEPITEDYTKYLQYYIGTCQEYSSMSTNYPDSMLGACSN